MSKHTPGPWRVCAGDETLVMTSDKTEVAQVVGDYVNAYAEMAANARLIAAAPDMLVALEAFVVAYKAYPDETPLGHQLTNGHFFRAIEAIAKARGQ